MNETMEQKSKLQAIGERAPIWLFVLAIVIALSFLVSMIAKMIKDEDTQGVEYDQARLRAYRSGGGDSGGRASSGYGKGRPSPPPSASKGPGQPGGGYGGGYAGR